MIFITNLAIDLVRVTLRMCNVQNMIQRGHENNEKIKSMKKYQRYLKFVFPAGATYRKYVSFKSFLNNFHIHYVYQLDSKIIISCEYNIFIFSYWHSKKVGTRRYTFQKETFYNLEREFFKTRHI